MESKSNYTIVGLFVLLLAAGLIIAGIWLSIGFEQKKYMTYIVYMHESVSGLNEESLVKYNGVKVGTVSHIELNQYNPQEVKVLLNIEEGTPITTGTRATLISQGITGTTYLGLSAISSTFTPLQKTPGEPYPVIPYQSSFFNQLEKNVTEISRDLKRIFDKENTANIKQTLDSIATVSKVFSDNHASLAQSIQEIPKLINELKTSADKFNTMAERLSAAGASVTTTMKVSKNAVNKLSSQTIPPFMILLQRLDLISANLEKVSAEMRQNPAVIIRGSRATQPGPGEK